MIVTPNEASRMLRMRITEVYRLLEDGELPAFKSGTAWKIPEQALQEFVMRRAEDEANERRRMHA